MFNKGTVLDVPIHFSQFFLQKAYCKVDFRHTKILDAIFCQSLLLSTIILNDMAVEVIVNRLVGGRGLCKLSTLKEGQGKAIMDIPL